MESMKMQRISDSGRVFQNNLHFPKVTVAGVFGVCHGICLSTQSLATNQTSQAEVRDVCVLTCLQKRTGQQGELVVKPRHTTFIFWKSKILALFVCLFVYLPCTT